MTTDPAAAASRHHDADRAILVAVVVGAHGVTGEVRLKVFATDLSAFRQFNDGALTMKALRDGRIARFAEIADRTAAEALRGTELTVPRGALPALADGEYYHVDLIGRACTADGRTIGHVVAVENFGAGDVLEIEKPDARRFMVPIAAATLDATIAIDPAFVE